MPDAFVIEVFGRTAGIIARDSRHRSVVALFPPRAQSSRGIACQLHAEADVSDWGAQLFFFCPPQRGTFSIATSSALINRSKKSRADMNKSGSSGSVAGSDKRASASTKGASPTTASLQPSFSDETLGRIKAVRAEAGTAADSLATDMKEAAKTATRAVTEQASEFVAEVGHELSKTAEDQKLHGVEAIQRFARVINTAATELEGQSPRVAQYVRDAAGKIEGFSGNIGKRNVSHPVRPVQPTVSGGLHGHEGFESTASFGVDGGRFRTRISTAAH